MQKKSIRKGILGLVLSLASVTAFSATIEGFWYSIDDKTGEKLSVIEIRKDAKTNIMERLFIVILLYQVLKHCRTVPNVLAH